ncbi:MAG: hypothetical protein ACR2N4_02835 [Jatrophihabitans sp.]
MNNPISAESLDVRLARLQDEYTYRVNMVLEEDRTDLAEQLSQDYLDDAARLLSSVS